MARPISVRGLTEGAILAALVAVLALAANYVPLVGVAAKIGVGVDPRVFAREVIELNKRSFDDAVQRYGRLGLDTRQMDASVTMMRDFFDYSYRLIPMLLLVGSFISAYLNYEVARHVLRRVGVKAPALPPMSMWGLPAIVLWALPRLSLLAALGARRLAPL